jgi:hypothetical protein
LGAAASATPLCRTAAEVVMLSSSSTRLEAGDDDPVRRARHGCASSMLRMRALL